MRLENRTAIVTGGAKGIGRAIVLRFVQEGAQVSIWDMDPEAGPAFAAELGSQQAIFQMVDVARPESVEAAVEQVQQDWGHIDILVNNAGILRDAQLVKVQQGEVVSRMTLEDFDQVIHVNLRGVFLCARAVAPLMIRQGYGRIINHSSIIALYGNFGQTNYAASKAGIIGMTKVWARELGRHHITVNAVASGFTETAMVNQMPRKILDRMIERTPLKRLGKPEEIANVFLFLASDESSFITGSVISADGGAVIGT